jgi:hypothetical protein
VSEVIRSEVVETVVDKEAENRRKTADEVCESIHNAARLAETAILSDDTAVKNALKTSAKVLLDAAMTKLDESIGTSVADAQDDDDE